MWCEIASDDVWRRGAGHGFVTAAGSLTFLSLAPHPSATHHRWWFLRRLRIWWGGESGGMVAVAVLQGCLHSLRNWGRVWRGFRLLLRLGKRWGGDCFLWWFLSCVFVDWFVSFCVVVVWLVWGCGVGFSTRRWWCVFSRGFVVCGWGWVCVFGVGRVSYSSCCRLVSFWTGSGCVRRLCGGGLRTQ